MPGVSVDVGHGTTIVFGTSAWTANVENIRWTGISRNAIETSHMSTAAAGANKFGNRTYIPGDLVAGGQLIIDGHFNPQTNPPIGAVTETITITWPLAAGDSTPANWASSGFMTSFEIGDPMDDKMTFSATIQLTGNVTMTDAT